MTKLYGLPVHRPRLRLTVCVVCWVVLVVAIVLVDNWLQRVAWTVSVVAGVVAWVNWLRRGCPRDEDTWPKRKR